MRRFERFYRIRGTGAAGFGYGYELVRSETRFGSGSAAIDVASMAVQAADEDGVVDFLTLPVDRVDDFVAALLALRDEIVADELVENLEV